MLTTDQSGAAARRFEYTPFGEPLVADPSESPYDARYTYAGKEYYDENLGIYYYGARYYYPAIGRWLGADPLVTVAPEVAVGDPQSLNLYAHRLSRLLSLDPLNGYDGVFTRGSRLGS